MRKYDVLITDAAKEDLQEIEFYISNELKEPYLAKNMISKLSSAILQLEKMPLRHALVSEYRLSYLGIRKLIVENYIVLYVVFESDKSVIILRVLYEKRNWIDIL